MVMMTRFVVLEPGTSTQLAVSPTPALFVWPCRCQPVLSEGQERLSWLPPTWLLNSHGVMLVIRSVPSVARVFVFHTKPAPGATGSRAVNAHTLATDGTLRMTSMT